jgi:hypothetical protein
MRLKAVSTQRNNPAPNETKQQKIYQTLKIKNPESPNHPPIRNSGPALSTTCNIRGKWSGVRRAQLYDGTCLNPPSIHNTTLTTAPQDPSFTGSRHTMPRVCGATKPGDGTRHGTRKRTTPLPSVPHHSTTSHTCSAKKSEGRTRPVALERTGEAPQYKYPSPAPLQLPGNP